MKSLVVPVRVNLPAPDFVNAVAGLETPEPMIEPLREKLPLPLKVRVLLLALVSRTSFESVRVWLAVCAVRVALPVVLVMRKVLSLVSELPVHVNWAALVALEMLMVPFVPNVLLPFVLPMFAAVRLPLERVTPPLKLLEVLLRTKVDVPVLLLREPAPLMTPERVPVRLVARLTARLLVRTRLLEMLTAVFTVPVPAKAIVGVVAPLLMNSRALPVMLKVGAVPLAGPAPVKESLFNWKPLPPLTMSLFEVALAPAIWVPVKIKVVVAALTGAVLPPQLFPAFHWVVPDAGTV